MGNSALLSSRLTVSQLIESKGTIARDITDKLTLEDGSGFLLLETGDFLLLESSP